MSTNPLKKIGIYPITRTLFKSDVAEYALGLDQNQEEVILKWTQAKQLVAHQFEHWAHEMRLLMEAESPYTLKPLDMGVEGEYLYMVFEFRDLSILWCDLDFEHFSFYEQIGLFLKISKALNAFHSAGICCRRFTPRSIALNKQLQEITLLDLEMAQYSREIAIKTSTFSIIEFQLPYLPPEQSGIVPIHTDLRSDLYILGCIFFETLFKRPVFPAQDSRAWLNAHVSQKVVFSAEDEKEYFQPILLILGKLLEKDPHQRYQSIGALKLDLESCLKLQQNKDEAIQFIPGRTDVAPELDLDQYPLSNRTLGSLFADSAEAFTPRIWWLEGQRGSGKTRLLQQHQTLPHPQEMVLFGSFSKSQQNVPYYGLKMVFEQVAELLLQEDQYTLGKWSNTLLEAVPAASKVLGDWIPGFRLSIQGGVENPATLPLLEARARFFKTLSTLLKSIAEERPLFLMLDDVHLADTASLDFLEHLIIEKNLPALCLCLSTTSNASNLVLRQALKNSNARLKKVKLKALSQENVLNWLSKTMGNTQWGLSDLAEVLHTQAQGLPRLLVQILFRHQQRQNIWFNFGTGCWEWNLEEIHQHTVIQAPQIDWAALETPTKKAIQRLALLQLTIFTAEDLPFLFSGVERPDRLLNPAREQGMIDIGFEEKNQTKQVYRIVTNPFWDKLRKEIRQEEAIAIHREIIEWYTKKQHEENFENAAQISDHYEGIGSQYWSAEEAIEAFKINLKCGNSALQAYAHQIADTYFSRALNHLPEQAWQHRYKETLELFLNAATVKLHTGAFLETLTLVEAVFKNSNQVYEKASAVELQIETWKQRNDLNQAIDCGLAYLAELGLQMHPNPSEMQSNMRFMEVLMRFGVLSEAQIISRKKVHDPVVLAKAKILIALGPLAYLGRPALVSPIMRENLLLVFNEGHLDHSAYWFASLAMVLRGRLNLNVLSFKAARIAEKLLNSAEYVHTRAKTLFTLNFFVYHWKKPMVQTVSAGRQSLDMAIQTHDQEFAAYSMLLVCSHALDAGIYLAQIQAELEEFIAKTASSYQIPQLNLLKIYRQYFKALTQSSPEAAFEPLDEQPEWYRDRTAIALRYLLELECLYFFGNYTQAKEVARLRAPLQDTGLATVYFVKFIWLQALTLLAERIEQQTALTLSEMQIVKGALKKYAHWSKQAPENFAAKNAFLHAEWNRYQQKKESARKYYDEAIHLANKYACFWLQALVWERMGTWLSSQNQESLGQVYLKQAREIWKEWGAERKVRQLDNLLENKQLSLLSWHSYEDELATVLQMGSTIVGALRYDELLDKLLRLLIEEFGAQEGMIARVQQDQAQVELEAFYEGHELLSRRPEDGGRIRNFIPDFVIQKIIESKEQLLLRHSAEYESIHAAQSHKLPAALFGYPILNRNQVIGLIFLFHHQLSSVFQEQHLRLLRLLAGQLGVSFQNALLYQEMEQEVKKRTETISQINQEIIQKNLRLEQQIELEKKLKQQQLELNELKLQALEQEKQVHIVNAEILGQALERKKIAGDLHDNVKSSLAAVSIQLTVLDNMDILEKSKESVQKARRSLKEAQNELHLIIHNLSPIVLHDLGLEGAIRELCEDWSTDSLPIVCHSDFAGARFNTKIELSLYSVCKEMIANAIKHSNARVITVDLKKNIEEGQIYLTVKDDGLGFSLDKKFRKNAIGITSIQSRIKFIEGQVSINSTLGKGTTFLVKAPAE